MEGGVACLALPAQAGGDEILPLDLTMQHSSTPSRDEAGSDDEGGQSTTAAAAAASPEPEPQFAEEMAASALELELTYKYSDAEKRASMRARLTKMSSFERTQAVARLRAKREEERELLTRQRVALSTFFSTHDPTGAKSPSNLKEKLIGMAMAARKPIKDEKWSVICAKLGETFGQSPNAFFN